MSHSFTLSQIAEAVGGTFRGDPGVVFSGIADVAEAGPDEVTWLSNPKYAVKLLGSRAGAVLVSADHGPTSMHAILCSRVDVAVAKLFGLFASPTSMPDPGPHPTSVVHGSAQLAAGVALGPHVFVDQGVRIGARSVLHAGVFVGRDSTIGDDCLIWPNVVIRDRCSLGHRVIIHPNAVIGADGFGFYFDEGQHNKVPHIGGVIIGDDVEIGACSCIDRAKFGNTIVGRGTKIDNLVQVAHNVRIGEHCVLAGSSGLAGSVRLGRYCVFGGRSGAANNLTIGDGARIALNSMATKDVPAGRTVSGFPAQEHRTELRMQASLRRLPEMADNLRELIARVEQLEASAHDQP